MEFLLTLAAVLIGFAGYLISRATKRIATLTAEKAAVSDERDRYLEVVDGLNHAVNGAYDDSLDIHEALRGEKDINRDRIADAISLIYSLSALDYHLAEAKSNCERGSVDDHVSFVRKCIEDAQVATTNISSYLAFNPGNALQQALEYQKVGNVVMVKAVIADNLAQLQLFLRPFTKTLQLMDQVGVSREEAGIQKGDPMDTILNVAAQLNG